jgi:polyphenol oxidase
LEKYSVNGLSLWQFTKFKDCKHFVTGRSGGVSKEPFSSLNMSLSAGDSVKNVLDNRKRLAEAIEILPESLVFVSQHHSCDVAIIRGKSDAKEGIEADAMVTNVPDVCICVMGADCVPVLAYDPKMKVVGAIHAGWKGTVASITTKTLQIMEGIFGCNMSDVILGIGPSISQEKYEVGEEVYLKFKENFGNEAETIFKQNSETGKYFPDLWLANQMQALKMGVSEANIEISRICTFTNHEEFFSARYFKNKTGRLAAGIMIK